MTMVHGPRSTVHGLALSSFSAILLILTYPNFNLHFFAWVALIPLFFALENKNIKEKFLIGYIFGLLFFAGVLYWLANVTVPGTIVAIFLLSFLPAIFCLFFPSSVVRRPSSVVLLPAAWVATEYIRTYYLSGFPWALLAYSQSSNLPVIQIADITGPYGVSFLIVLVNLGVYLALRKAPKRFYILFCIFILLTLTWSYGDNRMRRVYPTQKLEVSVVQGNIPQELKWDPQYRDYSITKYQTLTKEALRDKPRLVVWPETALPDYLEEKDLITRIANLAKTEGVYILTGALRDGSGKMYNSAVLVSDKGDILESYDKIHLVPFGEYVPLGRIFSWVRGFIDKPIGEFDSADEFTVFMFKVSSRVREKNEIVKTTDFYQFSALICFEDIFPDLCRRFVKNGARFLVNMTNDAWFGKSPAPYQHMQGSIFRAVENKVPVVRAANTGVSCIIDHKGRVIKVVKKGKDEIFVEGYATGGIMPSYSNTIYTRYGDVFSWVCIALVVVGAGTGLSTRWISVRKRPVPAGK